jgi:hypothetical protein
MQSHGMGAYTQSHLEELSRRKNTTVFTVQHDHVSDPWPADKLKRVMEKTAKAMSDLPADMDDFSARKKCIEDPEILDFYRKHLKTFLLITDREVMKDERYRQTMSALLELRARVERGEAGDEKEANAMATKLVMQTLSGKRL